MTEHPPLPADLYCPKCGYNLRGLTSRRCPECGLVLDFIESDTPIIPWERRRELGRFRAYWQTVLMVMFRNKLFCRAAYRPVSHRGARWFRWVCFTHAFVALVFMPTYVEDGVRAMLPEEGIDGVIGWLLALAYGCILLTLLALTRLPSVFFRSRFLPAEQRSRPVALSYYACAPLSCAPLVPILFWGARLLPHDYSIDLLPSSLATVLGAALPLLWWLTLIGIAQRTLRRLGSALAVALLVPVLWVVVAVLLLIVLPVALICGWMVLVSLL